MPKIEDDVNEALVIARAGLSRISGPDESPPVQICKGLADAMEALGKELARLGDCITAIENRPQSEIRRAYQMLVPGILKTMTWKRMAYAVAGCSTFTASACIVVGWLEYTRGASEAARWQAWCASPSHIANIGGKQVCQVPVQ